MRQSYATQQHADEALKNHHVSETLKTCDPLTRRLAAGRVTLRFWSLAANAGLAASV
jgi:hypothetical protein